VGSVRVVLLAALSWIAGCGFERQGTGDDLAFGDASVATDSGSTDAATPDLAVDDALVLDTFVADTVVPDTFVVDTFPVDAAPPCSEPTGKMFGGHCYFLLAAGTQTAAKADCAAAKAHLVTVNSDAEHSFLATMGSGDRWIGLEAPMPTNDRAQYVWITGEAKTVSHWYAADPDAMGPCVAMHGTLQEWVDRGCVEPNAGICERD